MIKNYLKIALRNLRKDKIHGAINIIGLAVGLACCLLIMLFVRNEWSYDRFHERADDLYRAWVLEDYGDNQRFFNTVTPYILGPTLAETFPEIEAVSRIMTFTDRVQRGDQVFNETLYLGEPNFFEIFDFPLVRGDATQALADRNSVVITERIVSRYFGKADPIGQTLSILSGEATEDFVVTAVAKNVVPNSGIRFDIMMPFALSETFMSDRAKQSWFNVIAETYVLLEKGAEGAALEAKMPTMVEQVLGDRVEAGQYAVGLQPMLDIHLNPEFPVGFAPVTDPAFSYILFGIALLVLFVACINFMTLSIGRSASRALEVGVRKVVGAERVQLMYQFWGEALLTSSLAVLLGIMLAQVSLPLFNDLSGQSLQLTFDAGIILFVLGTLVLVGLVAGSYPAIVLSRFRPIEVLKGKLIVRGDRSLFRRGLVVLQFTVSIALVACTLMMGQQFSYMQTRNLGFNKEQVVTIPTEQSIDEGLRLTELFRGEAASHPAVVNIAMASHTFGEGNWTFVGYNADDGTYRDFFLNTIDEAYVPTLGMEMVAGRNFSREITADRNQAILVNEALVAEYGWQNPIGQRLPGSFPDHEVIGVVKDFNYASLHSDVEPLVLTLNSQMIFKGASDVSSESSRAPKITVRIRPDDLHGTIAMLEETWHAIAPGLPFNYSFLDEALDTQYRQDERFGKMVSIATLLTILIACLGLFGLATLTAARRRKEIGIRKTMGASASGIVLLLSKEFTLLVVIAFVLAVPVAYFATNRWLQDFAYRIEISWPIFLGAGLIALLVALLAVSYQAIKAALSDPVKSLRYE